jgi:hypothetical protein
VHANILRPIAAPFVLGEHQGDATAISPARRVPWIDIEIIIIGAHAQKGYSGVIKDVLCNQLTPSGLRVVIQITSPVEATAPYRQVIVDYDRVLEARWVIFWTCRTTTDSHQQPWR